MKKCPQCHSIFTDELIYCTHDGTPLAAADLPSSPAESADFEPETVIRSDPFVVDVTGGNVSPAPVVNQTAALPVIIEKSPKARNYIIFLIIGLLLGGGLVLLALILGRDYFAANRTANNRRAADVEIGTTAKTGNQTTPPAKMVNEKHLKKTNAPDEEFNGRVIVANANIRSAPDLSATAIDALPDGDRINIERRENDNSPWFYVTCEHGASGWMHGNMIEYTE